MKNIITNKTDNQGGKFSSKNSLQNITLLSFLIVSHSAARNLALGLVVFFSSLRTLLRSVDGFMIANCVSYFYNESKSHRTSAAQ